MAETKLTIDASGILSGLDTIDAALLETSKNFSKVADAAKKAGADVQASFKIGAAQGVAAALENLQREYTDTKRSADVLKVALKAATDPAAVKIYTQAIEILDNELAQLEKRGKAAGVTLKEVGKNATPGQEVFAGLSRFAGAATGIFAALQGGSQIVQATREFERLFATLRQVTGSDLKAKQVFEDIQQFAKETPFQISELVGAFVKLESRNFNPTIDQLRAIGDVAASQGKSVDQFVEAILDAQTGEFERLKEFGILARKEGENLRVSFRGQEEVIRNNSDALSAYLLELGKLPGIQGSAVAVSKTLDGSISNLQDNFAQLFATIGGSGGILKGFVDGINAIVGGINELLSTPLSEELRSQQSEFNALVGVLQDTTLEETQRAEIIKILKTEYPGYLKFVNDDAKGQIDLAKTLEEGNKQFENRILLQATEEQRIELTRKRLDAEQRLTKELISQEQLKRSGTSEIRIEGQPTSGGTAQRQADLIAKLRQEISQTNQQIEDLLQTANQTALRTTGKNLSELQAELIKTGDEVTKVGDNLSSKNKKNAASEIDLARARAALIEDSLEKELAFERVRFLEQKANLEKLFAGRKELQELVERAQEQHEKNISQITTKYAVERLLKKQAELAAEAESIKRGLSEIESLQEEERKRLAANAKRNQQAQSDADALAKETFEASLLAAREVFFEKKRTDKEIEEYEKQVAKAKELFQLEQQRNELQRTLDFGQDLTSAEKAIIEQRIKNISTQIGQIRAGVGEQQNSGKPFSLFSLLGLDPNNPNFDRDVQAIKKAADEAVSAILSIADARLQAAEAAVEAANRELEAAEQKTEAAEQALEEEKELQDQGYANNVSDAEQNLALAEQFEAQKKAQRDKALQDQRKAQQAQIILDALLQSSNIITSASNIIKGFSAIPIVGGPLGIAAAATMVAGFVAAKIKAIQAVRAQQFRTGGSGYVGSDGVIVGPSHEGGGVQVPEYEGGEFFASDGKRFAVVNKKMTSKHYDLLKAINADDREGIARHAHLLSDFAPTFDIPAESMGGGIEIDRDEVARRVFGDGDSDSPAKIALAENEQLRRNNQLLEKMLAVMTKDANKGEWSADGKTFRKQGLTKRYLN